MSATEKSDIEDMIVGIEIENGSCDPDHAPFWWFVIHKPALQCTCVQNLTNSTFSHSSDIIVAHKFNVGHVPFNGYLLFLYWDLT